MRLNLFDVVFRPIKTSRKLMALMKSIELEPVFAEKSKAKVTADDAYTVITTRVLMPSAVFNMIAPSLVVVEMDGYSPVTWKRNKNQKIDTYPVSFENAVVMLVQERMSE